MATVETTKSIELNHVGPIEHLSIPIPENGGVVVLKGTNGSGKSHAIDSVEALYSPSARKGLRPSDGYPSGTVEGLGVTVRLGRTNTTRGELVCESLDGKVDPSQLVDPGLKDPVAADARRLATLVRLSGVKITADQWVAMAGDAGEEIAVASLVDDDPVATADRIRRRLHDSALAKERVAESQKAEAGAVEKTVADVDLSGESDEKTLLGMVEGATKVVSELKWRRDAFVDAAGRHAKAVVSLQSAKATLESTSNIKVQIEASEDAIMLASKERDALFAEVERLQRQLVLVKQDLTSAMDRVDLAKKENSELVERLARAERQAETVAALEAAVNEQLPEKVSDEQIHDAENARSLALQAAQRGEVIRRARGQMARAESLRNAATATEKLAARFRTLARSTDHVLEKALIEAGFTAIKVHDGRLCIESERGLEPFSELSHGERWRFALELASAGLPAGSILPVRQEAWESLDPGNRSAINAMAKRIGMTVLTAEADGGELRAEVVEGGGA